MKMTGWNVIITRFLLEITLGLGFIAAREYVTMYSLLMVTLLAGPVIHVVYHTFKFKPTKSRT